MSVPGYLPYYAVLGNVGITFLVPLSVLLHIVSLMKLRRDQALSPDPTHAAMSPA
jgi:hypothetical protein